LAKSFCHCSMFVGLMLPVNLPMPSPANDLMTGGEFWRKTGKLWN
jgi:hypothetical protein